MRVGLTILHFTDPTRTVSLAGPIVPRPVDTVLRYPIGITGPFPLIVFGHGYNVTPAPYAPLLDAWTKAGYVVAAPVFPLENANAPGGPNERDMPNQAGDMSLVISELSRPQDAATARVATKVNLARVAVSGQSDGGDTALAAAYDPHVRDPRVRAAVILSGAEDPLAPAYPMPAHGPPLLATQGSADTINPPSDTHAFFDQAAAPKYLLWLIGAGHLPPYTERGPELAAVVRASVAFLDRYLKGEGRALGALVRAGAAGPGTELFVRR